MNRDIQTHYVRNRQQQNQTPKSAHKYCLKKQKIDARDYKFEDHFKLSALRLPTKFDLRTLYGLPEPYDQGDLGSCTANGLGFCYHFNEIYQKYENIFMPSRLFIYYNERVLEGTVNEDAGAELRDGIKTINNSGVCDEKLWAYDISKFTVKPTQACYDQASLNKSVAYYAVNQNLTSIKTALYGGFPIVFGFLVYSSFETYTVANTGLVPYPDLRRDKLLGGHAVVAVGFDDSKVMPDKSKGAIIVRNSWGTGWGDKGYFYMPYKYITNYSLAWDFWVISKITNPAPTPAPTPNPAPNPVPVPVNPIPITNVIKDQVVPIIQNMQKELTTVQNIQNEVVAIQTVQQNITKELESIATIQENIKKELVSINAIQTNIQKEMEQVPNLNKEILNIQDIVSK